MTPDQSFASAIVAIYVILSLPALYVAFRHGFKAWAILGWGYLFIFCGLKIVGSAMLLNSAPGSSASLISSIGLGPLLLVAAGLLHEARFYRFSKQRYSPKTELIWVLLFHVLISTGVVLVAIGASNESSDKTEDQIRTDQNLTKVGVAILFLGWLILAVMSILSARHGTFHARHQLQNFDGSRLLIAVLFALPFLGVRVIASLTYFASGNQALNAATGSLGVRIGLYAIEELIATLLFIGAGLMTRNIRRHIPNEVTPGFEMPQY